MKYRTSKLILTVYFLLFIAVLAVLRASPATGYELSIYTYTPLLAWIFVAGTIVGGVAILIWQAFASNRSGWWLMGLFMLVTGNFLINSIPGLRGYFLYNPIDPGAHIGMIKDILDTGRIGASNIYPAMHILMAALSQITGMLPIDIAHYLPALLSASYILYIYLLAGAVLRERRQVLLAAACSAPLMFSFLHTAIYPQTMAFFILPLIFYLFFMRLNQSFISYGVIFVIMLLAFPFMHPHTVLAFVLFLVTIDLARFIYDKLWAPRNNINGNIIITEEKRFTPVFITLVTFFNWVSSFALFRVGIQRIYHIMLGDIKEPPIQLTFAATKMQMGTFDMVQYFLKTYGFLGVYAAITVFAAFIILLRIIKGDRKLRDHFTLVAWLIMGEIFSLSFFLGLSMQVPSRVIAADNALMISPLFVAFAFGYLSEKLRWRPNFNIIAAVAIVAIITVTSILPLYRSSYVYQVNWHSTYTDVPGSKWVLEHREPATLYSGIGIFHTDLEHILGHEYLLVDLDLIEMGIKIGYYGWFDVPTHFGYYGFWSDRTFNTIGQMYQDKSNEQVMESTEYRPRKWVRYWIFSRRGKIIEFDPDLRERRIASHTELGRWDFDREDFWRLENDPTVNKVYTSKDVEVWFVPYPPYKEL